MRDEIKELFNDTPAYLAYFITSFLVLIGLAVVITIFSGPYLLIATGFIILLYSTVYGIIRFVRRNRA